MSKRSKRQEGGAILQNLFPKAFNRYQGQKYNENLEKGLKYQRLNAIDSIFPKDLEVLSRNKLDVLDIRNIPRQTKYINAMVLKYLNPKAFGESATRYMFRIHRLILAIRHVAVLIELVAETALKAHMTDVLLHDVPISLFFNPGGLMKLMNREQMQSVREIYEKIGQITEVDLKKGLQGRAEGLKQSVFLLDEARAAKIHIPPPPSPRESSAGTAVAAPYFIPHSPIGDRFGGGPGHHSVGGALSEEDEKNLQSQMTLQMPFHLNESHELNEIRKRLLDDVELSPTKAATGTFDLKQSLKLLTDLQTVGRMLFVEANTTRRARGLKPRYAHEYFLTVGRLAQLVRMLCEALFFKTKPALMRMRLQSPYSSGGIKAADFIGRRKV